MEIVCSNMTSIEQIINNINTTVVELGSVPRLIESLGLDYCELPSLTIDSFRFLSRLQTITVSDSNITELSSAKETLNTDDTNGRYAFLKLKQF